MKKVAVITKYNTVELDDQVNKVLVTLQEQGAKIEDVKFSMSEAGNSRTVGALIIYWEPEEVKI